jgi:hypothetical protein
LDVLTDVTAPSNTPTGKFLGTTATGQWAPVDPPAVDVPNPSTVTPGTLSGTGGVIGTSLDYARADHRHTFTSAAPVALGPAAAVGTSQSISRADHVHPVPALDDLSNVTAPGSTPAGKVLGTTATGQWGPVNTIPNGSTDNGLLVWDTASGAWIPDDGSGVDIASSATVHKYLSLRTGFRDVPNPPVNGDMWMVGNKVMIQSGGQAYDITRLALEGLVDVDAPFDTPAGKVLGTTAEGTWGPVDPPGGTLPEGPTVPADLPAGSLFFNTSCAPADPGPVGWGKWSGTQAEYDAIAVKDPDVLYVIV